MTKEVMVTLSGLQLGDSGEDTVETVHIGEYYEKNGVHYLFFLICRFSCLSFPIL